MLDQIRYDGMRLTLVSHLYEERSQCVKSFGAIWQSDKDLAENFEATLDRLVFAHLALRCEYPVSLPVKPKPHKMDK